MVSITCLAELALCYLLPIKFTFSALVNARAEPIEQKKWAIFWAIIVGFLLIQSWLPFLQQYKSH